MSCAETVSDEMGGGTPPSEPSTESLKDRDNSGQDAPEVMHVFGTVRILRVFGERHRAARRVVRLSPDRRFSMSSASGASSVLSIRREGPPFSKRKRLLNIAARLRGSECLQEGRISPDVSRNERSEGLQVIPLRC